MELYVEAQPRTGAATTNVYACSMEWNEMEATWFKASESDWWDVEGGDFESKIEASFDCPSNAVNKWQEFDVTDLVQGFIEKPETNFGFHLFMSVTMVTLEYVSSESSKTDKRPKLTLDMATEISNNVAVEKEQIKVKKVSGRHSIQIPFSGNHSVKLYDAMGKQVAAFSLSGPNQSHILPASIVPGVHIVRITGSGKNIVKKLTLLK